MLPRADAATSDCILAASTKEIGFEALSQQSNARLLAAARLASDTIR
jgi:hypothetical protein